MTPNDPIANQLYADGMSHNWRQAESFEQATLSRANLEQAAARGHLKAMREFAEMLFAGSGGTKDCERALWLKWQAHKLGDRVALEELTALLESYSEEHTDVSARNRADLAARKSEETSKCSQWLGDYLEDVFSSSRLRGAPDAL